MWVREACDHIQSLSRVHNSCKKKFYVTKCPKTVVCSVSSFIFYWRHLDNCWRPYKFDQSSFAFTQQCFWQAKVFQIVAAKRFVKVLVRKRTPLRKTPHLAMFSITTDVHISGDWKRLENQIDFRFCPDNQISQVLSLAQPVFWKVSKSINETGRQ